MIEVEIIKDFSFGPLGSKKKKEHLDHGMV